MSFPRNRSSHRPALALVTLLALAAAGCGGGDDAARLREENEALKRQLAEAAPVPVGEAPASAALKPPASKPSADDWAWADAPAGSASTSPPASVEAARATPKPVEPAKPRPATPAPKPTPKPEPEPTNRLAPAPVAPEPEQPRLVARTAEAGTSFDARLQGEISAMRATVGDSVAAMLDADVVDRSGQVVLPAGTRLTGRITEVKAPGKAKKKAVLAFRFEQATLPDGTTAAVSAGRRLEGDGYTKKDGAIIGGSAAGGALLGQILGKDSESTAAGAVLGGAIATGVVMSKRGDDVVVPAGTILGLELETPVTVSHPVS